jgi:hypothetical protein
MLQAGLLDKLKARASTRQLSDLTIGPVLTWTTQAMLEHMDKLLQLPGRHDAQQRSSMQRCCSATHSKRQRTTPCSTWQVAL